MPARHLALWCSCEQGSERAAAATTAPLKPSTQHRHFTNNTLLAPLWLAKPTTSPLSRAATKEAQACDADSIRPGLSKNHGQDAAQLQRAPLDFWVGLRTRTQSTLPRRVHMTIMRAENCSASRHRCSKHDQEGTTEVS